MKDQNKYIILLSGGLDSTVNAYSAAKEGEVLLALTFNYGQRAAQNEIKAAQKTCNKLNIPHRIIDLPWLRDVTNTALVNSGVQLPTLKNLDDIHESKGSAEAVWVPNRNGIFLNIGAAFAENLGAHFVVPGFNKEEAATFPDNSNAFLHALNSAFKLSTAGKVQVACFTSTMDKAEILKLALELKVNLSDIWSCYEGFDQRCEKCESCQRTMRAEALVL